jgi:hypothetical protein
MHVIIAKNMKSIEKACFITCVCEWMILFCQHFKPSGTSSNRGAEPSQFYQLYTKIKSMSMHPVGKKEDMISFSESSICFNFQVSDVILLCSVVCPD